MAWMLFCPTSHWTDIKPQPNEKDIAGIWWQVRIRTRNEKTFEGENI